MANCFLSGYCANTKQLRSTCYCHICIVDRKNLYRDILEANRAVASSTCQIGRSPFISPRRSHSPMHIQTSPTTLILVPTASGDTVLSQPVSPNGNGVGPGSQTPREAPESSRASVSNGSDGGGSSFRSKGSSQKSSTNGASAQNSNASMTSKCEQLSRKRKRPKIHSYKVESIQDQTPSGSVQTGASVVVGGQHTQQLTLPVQLVASNATGQCYSPTIQLYHHPDQQSPRLFSQQLQHIQNSNEMEVRNPFAFQSRYTGYFMNNNNNSSNAGRCQQPITRGCSCCKCQQLLRSQSPMIQSACCSPRPATSTHHCGGGGAGGTEGEVFRSCNCPLNGKIVQIVDPFDNTWTTTDDESSDTSARSSRQRSKVRFMSRRSSKQRSPSRSRSRSKSSRRNSPRRVKRASRGDKHEEESSTDEDDDVTLSDEDSSGEDKDVESKSTRKGKFQSQREGSEVMGRGSWHRSADRWGSRSTKGAKNKQKQTNTTASKSQKNSSGPNRSDNRRGTSGERGQQSKRGAPSGSRMRPSSSSHDSNSSKSSSQSKSRAEVSKPQQEELDERGSVPKHRNDKSRSMPGPSRSHGGPLGASRDRSTGSGQRRQSGEVGSQKSSIGSVSSKTSKSRAVSSRSQATQDTRLSLKNNEDDRSHFSYEDDRTRVSGESDETRHHRIYLSHTRHEGNPETRSEAESHYERTQDRATSPIQVKTARSAEEKRGSRPTTDSATSPIPEEGEDRQDRRVGFKDANSGSSKKLKDDDSLLYEDVESNEEKTNYPRLRQSSGSRSHSRQFSGTRSSGIQSRGSRRSGSGRRSGSSHHSKSSGRSEGSKRSEGPHRSGSNHQGKPMKSDVKPSYGNPAENPFDNIKYGAKEEPNSSEKMGKKDLDDLADKQEALEKKMGPGSKNKTGSRSGSRSLDSQSKSTGTPKQNDASDNDEDVGETTFTLSKSKGTSATESSDRSQNRPLDSKQRAADELGEEEAGDYTIMSGENEVDDGYGKTVQWEMDTKASTVQAPTRQDPSTATTVKRSSNKPPTKTPTHTGQQSAPDINKKSQKAEDFNPNQDNSAVPTEVDRYYVPQAEVSVISETRSFVTGSQKVSPEKSKSSSSSNKTTAAASSKSGSNGGAEKSANQVSSNKSDSSSKTGNSRSKETVTNRSSETSQSKPHNYESVDDATDKSAAPEADSESRTEMSKQSTTEENDGQTYSNSSTMPESTSSDNRSSLVSTSTPPKAKENEQKNASESTAILAVESEEMNNEESEVNYDQIDSSGTSKFTEGMSHSLVKKGWNTPAINTTEVHIEPKNPEGGKDGDDTVRETKTVGHAHVGKISGQHNLSEKETRQITADKRIRDKNMTETLMEGTVSEHRELNMPRQERTNANQPLGDVKRTPAPINNSPVNKNNQRFQPRVSETPNSANHSATNRNYQSRSPIDIHNWRGLAIQESFSSSQTSSERFNEYKNGRILDIIAERAKRGNINRIVFAENEQIERNELRRDQSSPFTLSQTRSDIIQAESISSSLVEGSSESSASNSDQKKSSNDPVHVKRSVLSREQLSNPTPDPKLDRSRDQKLEQSTRLVQSHGERLDQSRDASREPKLPTRPAPTPPIVEQDITNKSQKQKPEKSANKNCRLRLSRSQSSEGRSKTASGKKSKPSKEKKASKLETKQKRSSSEGADQKKNKKTVSFSNEKEISRNT
ncbi:uncharacterized protein LOC142347877 isoform X2 [Convolutriloba macropyga]|uniref:uncharacterized protein LOC142347877 isoform X2 n=1 Tax=Convolutriloba macropyga TaxID=536237 RepID=UPI003F52568C